MNTSCFPRRRRSRSRLLHAAAFFALGGLLFGVCPALLADTVVYTVLNDATAGGLTSGGTASQNSRLLADDITFAAGSAGAQIDSISFSVFNGNSVTAAASPQLVLYANDGPGGGPGTVLYTIGLFALQLNAGSFSTYTLNSAEGFFTIPASNSIWAGIYYTPNAANNAVNFGQEVYGAPTVGSSTTNTFQSTGAGSTSNAPAGSLFQIAPPNKFNLGWAFSATNFPAPVPEPSSVALLGVAGIVGLSLCLRRRRPSLRCE